MWGRLCTLGASRPFAKAGSSSPKDRRAVRIPHDSKVLWVVVVVVV